ncbi:uncharacterized protein I206_105889 [Kwoniella pini CBS 10737]|uniref:Cysteine-rich PDZ-binding protein n=1 Tax=Kwoniella pini CBS 10737 TaxID=1296096 RepID=A0A1B9I0G1_9TREE|nr:uncharacterized protein I206_04709 [Kwoniella pini CBS 10737]OCF49022.1 hypothetical protein I206_04709 [Kwoniella pini CBS 10737]
MVCKKCEKKLSTVAAPDPFKPSSSTRVIGENKLLSSRAKSSPYAKPGTGLKKGNINPYKNCIDCKQPAQQNNATRCQKCAYKKGLCAICGTLVLTDIGRYKQTAK